MEFRNIFTLNDWKFKEFAAVIILIQVLMWVVGFFSYNQMHIPIFNDIAPISNTYVDIPALTASLVALYMPTGPDKLSKPTPLNNPNNVVQINFVIISK